MKIITLKFKYILSAILVIGSSVLFCQTVRAETKAASLSGRILLEVEKHGEAWYVDPVTDRRAYLGRPYDAFQVMRAFGLGVNSTGMGNIRASVGKRQSLAGRILIQVDNHGAAYYLNPTDLALYYLGRPADAFRIMRNLGLGITDADLAGINVDPRYTDVAAALSTVKTSSETTSNQASSTAPVENWQVIAANTCTAWTYTDWSSCSKWGIETRTIVTALPDGCAGGDYVLERSCAPAAGTTTAAVKATSGPSSMDKTASSSALSLDDKLLAAGFSDIGKNVGMSCKPWVDKIVGLATDGTLSLPFMGQNNYSWQLDPSGPFLQKNINIENAGRADIVQMNLVIDNNLPHTAIIVTATPAGMVWIHSNWDKADTVSTDFITYAYFNYAVKGQYSIYHVY